MRRLVLACVLLLIAVPAAGARSYEADALSGEFSFRADPTGQAAMTIASIGPGTRIIGPKGLRGIACVDDELDLAECVTLKRTKTTTTWTVRRPVSLTHMQMGDFAITLKKAVDVSGLFISGCGKVRVTGTGTYRADGADAVSYTPADTAVVITLEP